MTEIINENVFFKDVMKTLNKDDTRQQVQAWITIVKQHLNIKRH